MVRFLFGGGQCKWVLQAGVGAALILITLEFTPESPTIFHGLPIMYEPFQIHKETHFGINERLEYLEKFLRILKIFLNIHFISRKRVEVSINL